MRRVSPPSESDGARIPKACLPCAHVKVRCEIEAGDETCKRCRRLRKTCSGQAPGAHRRKKVKTSETARLEDRCDSVTAILSAAQQVLAGLSAAPASNHADLTPKVWIDQFVKSDSEADMILQVYRSEMEPLFPFVVTTPSMTFMDLREKKPFLVLAILMVGCRYDQIRQTAIAKKIREIISYNLLIKGEKDLDMLQGLLVYVNWYHLHLNLGSQICNLVHLIMAMMIELGLNKGDPPKNLKGFSRLRYLGETGSVPSTVPIVDAAASRPNSTRTLEERRTFLGCFYLTSIVSMCKRDIEPIRYSKYVDECCRAISEAAEYPRDIYVVSLARLCGLADRITRTLNDDDCLVTSAFTSAPIGAFVKSLESELLQLRSSLPEETPENAILFMHYYVVEIFLYQTALNDNVDALRYGAYPFARLNMLYACLNSTKLCFEIAYSFSLSKLFDLPYTIWSFLGYAFVVLSRLSLFRVEGWDHEYIRDVLDISESIDKLARRLDEAKALAETASRHNDHNPIPRHVPQLFLMLSSNLQKVKAAHEAKYAAQTKEADQYSNLSCAETAVMLTNNEYGMPPPISFFEFLDENFWQQFT